MFPGLPLPAESFVSGGILLIVFGAALASLRRLPGQLWQFAERHMLASLHVYDTDEAFYWVKMWMGGRLRTAKSKTTVTRRPGGANDMFDTDDDVRASDYKRLPPDQVGKDRRPQVTLVPAPGLYFFVYRRRLCWVDFERKESEGTAGFQKPRESFVIRCLSRNTNLLTALLDDARDTTLPLDDRVEIRTGSGFGWELAGRVPGRPLDSVILSPGVIEGIVDDIRQFRQSQEWYAQLGIPYRRGYLLYGPPGGGKSSLVLAIASELGMNVNILYLSDPNMNDSRLQDQLNKADPNTIILVEDVDSAFVRRKKVGGSKVQSLTFSGLLNAIDGIGAQGGRVLFMTTNRVAELDPALVRPGRADVRVLISNATGDQAATLFGRFFHGDARAAEFGQAIPPDEVSMAAIQGHLLKYRDDPVAAIAHVPDMVAEERAVRAAREAEDKADGQREKR